MDALPMIDMQRTGQRIQDMRIQHRMTVQDIQSVFGFNTPQAIYKWQQGRALPTLDNLVVLARLFDVKLDDLIVIA